MLTRPKRNVKNTKCPLTLSLEVIGGKWKPLIIYNLSKSKKRFGQLDAIIPGISRKVLTDQLNQLVTDQLVIRNAFAETPPRVEYSLSEKGKELVPLLKGIAKWGTYLVEK
ncbi:MAG: helix-turn-helix transcriptional regulator [Saprospiraceae bacterium]|nr:helix-turn-helix transcriptional regulator [Saprospiraceae bacterium]